MLFEQKQQMDTHFIRKKNEENKGSVGKKGGLLSPQEHCQAVRGSRAGRHAEQTQRRSDWTHTKVIRVRAALTCQTLSSSYSSRAAWN